MKKILILSLILLPLLASAQVITYDTVRVSPTDERNIYRNQSQQRVRQSAQRPVLLQDVQSSGFVFDKSRLRYGVNIGLSFSRNYTVFGLGPQVGYQFSNNLMAGVGAKYYYTKMRGYDYESKSNLVGVNIFGYFYPVQFLTVFAQPELNYIKTTMKWNSEAIAKNESGLVPSFVVGAGFRLGRSHITLNYDLVRQSRSPYPSGFFLGVSAFF